MKIQSLLSKLGWIVTGQEFFFIVYNYFVRFNIRDEVMPTVKPEEVPYYENMFAIIIKGYIIEWSVILFTGVLIAVMIYKWLHLRHGICACIAIIICRIIGFYSLQVLKIYEKTHVVTTLYPSLFITIACCILSLIPFAGVLFYKKIVAKVKSRRKARRLSSLDVQE